MASKAWKDHERRMARLFGGRRAGPLGAAVSDIVNVPFAIECKQTARYSLRRKWIDQARRQSKNEGKPWLLLIHERGSHRSIAVMDAFALAEVTQLAGLTPKLLEIVEDVTDGTD